MEARDIINRLNIEEVSAGRAPVADLRICILTGYKFPITKHKRRSLPRFCKQLTALLMLAELGKLEEFERRVNDL